LYSGTFPCIQPQPWSINITRLTTSTCCVNEPTNVKLSGVSSLLLVPSFTSFWNSEASNVFKHLVFERQPQEATYSQGLLIRFLMVIWKLLYCFILGPGKLILFTFKNRFMYFYPQQHPGSTVCKICVIYYTDYVLLQ